MPVYRLIRLKGNRSGSHAHYMIQTRRVPDTTIHTMESLKNLIQSGTVTAWQLQLIVQICRQFFFLGWPSRGAVEDAEQLKRNGGMTDLMRTSRLIFTTSTRRFLGRRSNALVRITPAVVAEAETGRCSHIWSRK